MHDLDVDPNRTYWYQLQGKDALGHETQGSVTATTPTDGIPPAVPREVRAISGPLANQVTVG